MDATYAELGRGKNFDAAEYVVVVGSDLDVFAIKAKKEFRSVVLAGLMDVTYAQLGMERYVAALEKLVILRDDLDVFAIEAKK